MLAQIPARILTRILIGAFVIIGVFSLISLAGSIGYTAGRLLAGRTGGIIGAIIRSVVVFGTMVTIMSVRSND